MDTEALSHLMTDEEREHFEREGYLFLPNALSPEEVDAFEQQAHFHACVDLRIWDEEAKDPTKEHPAFDYYRPLLEALLAEHADISTQGSAIN